LVGAVGAEVAGQVGMGGEQRVAVRSLAGIERFKVRGKTVAAEHKWVLRFG